MKKYVLMMLLLSVSAGIQAADLKRDDVVGKWLCATQYDSVKAITLDKYEFLADGSSKSEGSVIVPLGEEIGLNFHVKKSGKWSFNQGVLSEVANTESVKKAHNTATEALLKKEKALAELERGLYDTLSQQPANEAERTIPLKWTRDKNDPKKVLVEQMDETNGKGFCYRVAQ